MSNKVQKKFDKFQYVEQIKEAQKASFLSCCMHYIRAGDGNDRSPVAILKKEQPNLG